MHSNKIILCNIQTGSMNQLMTFCLLEVVSYPSEAPEVTPVGLCFARSLVFCVVFCRSLFVFFLLAIALSVLQFTASDYLHWNHQTFREVNHTHHDLIFE